MLNVTQLPPRVNPPDRHLARNVKVALSAGYNVRVSTAAVYVNGVTVDRAYFEELHPLNLLALLDKFIGRGV